MRSWPQYANISFSGWNVCPAAGFQGLEVTASTNNVTATLGRPGDNHNYIALDLSANPSPKWGQCTTNGLDREQCIEACAIHEFAHGVGVAHEHLRPENKGRCNASTEMMQCGDTGFKAFDLNSIMSYCLTAPAGIRPDEEDVHGVIAMYGMSAALVATVSPL